MAGYQGRMNFLMMKGCISDNNGHMNGPS